MLRDSGTAPAMTGRSCWTNAPSGWREERTRLNAPENDGWEARFVYNGKPPSDPDFGEEAVFIKKLPAGRLGGLTIPDLPGTWLKKTIQDWAGLNDCAHYLSCCLGKNGGKAGVPEREKPDALIKELRSFARVRRPWWRK